MNQSQLKKLHTNQRLLVLELQKRGVKVRSVDSEIELLEASINGKKEYILDRYSSAYSYPITKLSSDKCFVKRLLNKYRISVPEGEVFDRYTKEKGIEYGKDLGFPLVVKPNWGSHGDSVIVDINSGEELRVAIDSLFREKGLGMPFIIERFCPGQEYRVFITVYGDCAVLNREPAYVIGDGIKTIEQLARDESNRRQKPRKNSLCPIVLNRESEHLLQTKQLTLDSIPGKGEKVYVQRCSNIAKGGMCRDVTGITHPSVVTIARKILKLFPGIPYLGIDFLSTNITIKQTSNTYVILEVNANPGFAMHMLPGEGESRDVASYAVDCIFPETRE